MIGYLRPTTPKTQQINSPQTRQLCQLNRMSIRVVNTCFGKGEERKKRAGVGLSDRFFRLVACRIVTPVNFPPAARATVVEIKQPVHSSLPKGDKVSLEMFDFQREGVPGLREPLTEIQQ